MATPPTDRAAIAADLERARTDFQRLLTAAKDADWNRPTSGTRWTNEQLLFHMVFGYMVVRRLIFLMRVFGRLPDRVSRSFALLLDAATPSFHVVNYCGSCAAALVFNRRRMGRQMNRVIRKLQESLAVEDATTFESGMHYPPRWDPYFRDYMTLADVYRYPGRHYDHHRQQLTLSGD
ncbi:DinB family protein [Mycobacterium sp. NPDC051804]|uniref:DinB family protein n=1 Tax=Mycobacterium sp. NPDC051804 TaxID=3364295 RepID=UPI0037AEC40A